MMPRTILSLRLRRRTFLDLLRVLPAVAGEACAGPRWAPPVGGGPLFGGEAGFSAVVLMGIPLVFVAQGPAAV